MYILSVISLVSVVSWFLFCCMFFFEFSWVCCLIFLLCLLLFGNVHFLNNLFLCQLLFGNVNFFNNFSGVCRCLIFLCVCCCYLFLCLLMFEVFVSVDVWKCTFSQFVCCACWCLEMYILSVIFFGLLFFGLLLCLLLFEFFCVSFCLEMYSLSILLCVSCCCFSCVCCCLNFVSCLLLCGNEHSLNNLFIYMLSFGNVNSRRNLFCACWC